MTAQQSNQRRCPLTVSKSPLHQDYADRNNMQSTSVSRQRRRCKRSNDLHHKRASTRFLVFTLLVTAFLQSVAMAAPRDKATRASFVQHNLQNGRSKSVLHKRPHLSTIISTSQRSNNDSIQKVPHKTKTQIETARRIRYLICSLFFMYYASLGSLLPYLPVYYQSLGHGGQKIGVLGAVKPFTTFLVAPIWGLIADQSAQTFAILKFTFLVSLGLQLAVCLRPGLTYLTAMSFLTAVFNAPVKSLLDSMVMDHTDPGSYGQLRLFGQLGFGFGSSVVGLVLANSKHVAWPAKSTLSDAMLLRFEQWHLAAVAVLVNKAWQSLTSYKLLFVAHAVLSVPTWMAIRAFQRLNLNSTTGSHRPNATVTALSKSKRQSKKVAATNNNNNNNNNNIQKGLSLLLHNADALLFFFLVFVVGVSSGVVENFAYVRMREVGGTGKAMGLSRLVSSLAGAPMFWYSGPLTEALGADRVILLSLTSYALRFLIYAFMRNPYHGLPAEALRGVTFAAFWSTSTIYAHRVSPPGLHATMLMFLNAMYGGLGQSLGAIIGGKMQHKFGTVITFLYAAAFDLMFVAMLVAYLSLRKDSSFKNPKPIVAHTSYE